MISLKQIFGFNKISIYTFSAYYDFTKAQNSSTLITVRQKNCIKTVFNVWTNVGSQLFVEIL